MHYVRFPILRPASLFNRKTAKDDAMAGLVLGVESVPDGLASGLLAGVNPVAGLYAYLYGLLGGALFSSTSLMAVQGTGAMAIIVADADLSSSDDPLQALYSMTILTGIVMAVAGFLGLGGMLRFVSNSVMAGFVGAVGVNIVLGQLGDFTGYSASGANRVMKAVNTVLNPGQIDLWTLAVGVATMYLIVALQRTRLGAMGLVVAVFIGSGFAALLGAFDRSIQLVGDIATIPQGLPFPGLPSLSGLPDLVLPAVSMAFVGLVQGAGVSAGFPNSDGSQSNQSQDFVAQGAGNIVSGLFQGMPVGGSMSATALVDTAGAKTRQALFVASGVMAMVVLVFGGVIQLVAMPSLAALLIVVGYNTVNLNRMRAVAQAGRVPATVMAITFVLTVMIRLQYAVLVGVGISVILLVIQQSAQLRVKRLVYHPDGLIEEVELPVEVSEAEVIIVRPYGQLFFATAETLRGQLPAVTSNSKNSVVILRLRGAPAPGVTLIQVLADYSDSLHRHDCRLMLVTDNDALLKQFNASRTGSVNLDHDVYASTQFLGQALKDAHTDALTWVSEKAGTKVRDQRPVDVGGTAEDEVDAESPAEGIAIEGEKANDADDDKQD